MPDIEKSSEEYVRKGFWRRARWIFVGCFVAALIDASLRGQNLMDINQIAGALGAGAGLWLVGGGIAYLFRRSGGSDKERLLGIWATSSAVWYFFMLIGGGVIDVGQNNDQPHSAENSPTSAVEQLFSINNKELDDYLREVSETLPAPFDENIEMTEVRRIGSSIIYELKLTNDNPTYFRPQFQSELSAVISQNLCTKGVSKRLFLDNGYVIVYRYADTTSQPLMEIHVSSNTCKDLATARTRSE